LDIVSKLTKAYPNLSKGRKRIVDYILENKDDAAFMSAAELARKANISESVVVRFVTSIGYSGYKEMQESLVGELKRSIGVADVFENFTGTLKGAESVYANVLTMESENVNNTVKGLDTKTIEEMVDNIISSNKVGIVAVRGATSVALVLQLFLNQILGNVYLLTPNFLDAYDRIRDWGENDFLIGISFLNETNFCNSIMDYAIEKGCKTGAITDSYLNHLARNADYLVLAEVKSPFVSYTAPMMIVSIIAGLVVQKLEEQGNSFESMKEIEKIISRL
jgi:DNA-binding MurR/RpiR family transcriptional regulator